MVSSKALEATFIDCYTPRLASGLVNQMGGGARFSLISLLFLLSLHLGQALSPEGATLIAFKAAVIDPQAALGDWNPADSFPCNWTGVWCDAGSKQVVSINLSGRNLSGNIVPDLGQLKKLHRLYLQYNNFYGAIPPQLANCTRIRTINLHHNNLSGDIPPQLGGCSLLQALYLQNNMLSGSIPLDFGSLTNLLTLDLSFNLLAGGIPSNIGNLSYLNYLNLSYNQLVGGIPTNGVFSKFGASSFLGNIHLCGKLGFPECQPLPLQPVPLITGSQPPNSSIRAQGISHGLSTIEIAAICVGAFLLLKVFCILCLLRRWSRKNEYKEINLGSGGKLVMFQGGASVSSSRELLKCIGKLGQKDVIGEGGYGVVYKLVLKNSSIFAVKKLKQCLESVRGFEAELETLGAIKHRNLVKLRGYCTSSTVKLLIYEYLPNGTLDHLLHERTPDQKPLDWHTRHKIALGVARGLAYLHHGCDPRIIHRDVSTTNILLDADLEAHLADFGLARLIGMYDTHITATVAGTFGYIAPEYAEGGRATDKVDVYGMGVVLLELLTGKRPAEASQGEDINLAAWVRRLQEEGHVADVVDNFLKDTAPEKELQIALYVACLCISKNPENRPSMKRVVEWLDRDDLSLSPVTKLDHEKVGVES